MLNTVNRAQCVALTPFHIRKYPPNNFFFFDTIVQNIFKNTITVYNLQMYLDWLAVVVNSGLITTTIDCKSGKNVHQFTHFHQFGVNFIGKDEVFHGLLYQIIAFKL